MDDNQIKSLRREKFFAGWFIRMLGTKIEDSHQWDEAGHNEFMNYLRVEVPHVIGKMDAERHLRQAQDKEQS